MLKKNNNHISNIFCGDQHKQLYIHLLEAGIKDLGTGCIKSLSIKLTLKNSKKQTQVYKVACMDAPIIQYWLI